MQIPGCGGAGVRARCRGHGVRAGGERRENRLEPGKHVRLGADHQAVAALASPDAAARADGSAKCTPDAASAFARRIESGYGELPPSMMMSPGDRPRRDVGGSRGRSARPAPSATPREAPPGFSRTRPANPMRSRRPSPGRARVGVDVVHDAVVRALRRRRTISAPLRPSPIMPSCMTRL